jgi:CspA family cold shock protein
VRWRGLCARWLPEANCKKTLGANWQKTETDGKDTELAFCTAKSHIDWTFSRSWLLPARCWFLVTSISERLDRLRVLRSGTSRSLKLRVPKKEIAMINGTVKFFNATKGFGFIQPDDGSKDAFVHISAVERAGLAGLADGQKVTYEVETGRDGRLSATNLQII